MNKRLWIILAVTLLLVAAFLLPACAQPAPAPAPTPAPTPTPAPAPKTLKIGLIGWMGWPLGLDMLHGVQIMSDGDNKNGGLAIGGDKYQVQLIYYDSKADQSTAVAAANKLIFEDKVSFIISDSQFADGWFPIADQNKVIAIIQAPSQEFANPKYKYVFNGPYMNAQNIILPGWFAKSFPEKNNIVIALPDTQMGHLQGPIVQTSFDAFKWKSQIIYYPADQQDQSALGTKVKTLNPDVFTALAGGPIGDGLCYKAAFQAGYRGQFFASNAAPFLSMSQVIPAEALEGMINYAWPVEFDNPPTQQAREFKEAYIAKNGKWDGPDIINTANYALLRTALLQAGSLDVDKVAAVISGGLKYEGPTGVGQMISRPDMGNNRTVDSISSYYVKQIQGGKLVQIDQISLEDGLTFFRAAFPVK